MPLARQRFELDGLLVTMFFGKCCPSTVKHGVTISQVIDLSSSNHDAEAVTLLGDFERDLAGIAARRIRADESKCNVETAESDPGSSVQEFSQLKADADAKSRRRCCTDNGEQRRFCALAFDNWFREESPKPAFSGVRFQMHVHQVRLHCHERHQINGKSTSATGSSGLRSLLSGACNSFSVAAFRATAPDASAHALFGMTEHADVDESHNSEWQCQWKKGGRVVIGPVQEDHEVELRVLETIMVAGIEEPPEIVGLSRIPVRHILPCISDGLSRNFPLAVNRKKVGDLDCSFKPHEDVV